MKLQQSSIALALFCASLLSVLSSAQDSDFDFFYFVQQWPGSYCDTRRGCCYPTTGKPEADFGIHGLWPNYNDGSYPSNCDPDSSFDRDEISDLLTELHEYWPTLACPSGNGYKFWGHEWEKHGTCSESALDQHSYFKAALKLHKKANLLSALREAGIAPDGGEYSIHQIEKAIHDAVGYKPGVQCNTDESHENQLYQIYLCVDTNGEDFIECPVYPRGRCRHEVEFPSF